MPKKKNVIRFLNFQSVEYKKNMILCQRYIVHLLMSFDTLIGSEDGTSRLKDIHVDRNVHTLF